MWFPRKYKQVHVCYVNLEKVLDRINRDDVTGPKKERKWEKIAWEPWAEAQAR